MKERKSATITQQIILDSRYKTSGTDGEYMIDLTGLNTNGTTYSNVFFSNFKDVIAMKVLGVFIKDTLEARVVPDGGIYVDILCPQIPYKGQQLQAHHGYVWCRVPLERNYNYIDPRAGRPATDSSMSVLTDQWWQTTDTRTRYFPPHTFKQLDISLKRFTNVSPSALETLVTPNYLIVEVTRLNRTEGGFKYPPTI